MNSLTGTLPLVRLALRRDRVMLPIWLAVFIVMASMAVASMLAVWFIDPKRIDHRAARGLPDKEQDSQASK